MLLFLKNEIIDLIREGINHLRLIAPGPRQGFISIDTHFEASTLDSFWKHCGKRRNCSSWAISPFATTFSTRSVNCIPICPFFFFLTSYLYLLLNWKCLKLAYEVKVKVSPTQVANRGSLTHAHTVTPFDASRKQAFWKHCGKRRNCS